MRYLAKSDEETIMTLNLITNFPERAERIMQELEKNYRKNPDNPEAAFIFGFFTFVMTSKVLDSDIGSRNVELIFDAFNHALELAPDYWLARLFKVILLIELPEVMRSEDELWETLDTLIAQQKEAPEQVPYFVVPYILRADFSFGKNNRDDVIKYLDLASEVTVQPINFRYLNVYLSMPFKNMLIRLVRSNERELANRVYAMAKMYFPKETSFDKYMGGEPA